jgi:hypothetical protein
VVAASKEQGSKMMNNKGRISRYPAAHTENSNLPPILSFSTSWNQIFVFFAFVFFIFFSQPGAQEDEQHQISAQTDERCDRYKFRSVWENWC